MDIPDEIDPDKIKTIRCDSCNKKLMNVIIINNCDITTVIQAKCPFCKNPSFSLKETITGKFYYGPIGPDESAFPTNIESTVFYDDYISFVIESVNK